MQQNDPATGCRYDPFYGYGFRVTFEWSRVTGINTYEIQLKHPGASIPLLEQRVQSTRHTYIACGVVPGAQGWQWKVRAIGTDGQASEWSSPHFLNFTSCRLENGLGCAEQPEE